MQAGRPWEHPTLPLDKCMLHVRLPPLGHTLAVLKQGWKSQSTQGDIAYFDSLTLLSPRKGVHDVSFSSLPLDPVTLSVIISEGEAVRLKVVSAVQTVYAAEALVTVQPITLGVYDAGSNFVGSSNHLTKEVFANITGGLIGSSGLSQNTEFDENIEILRTGFGTVTFDKIKLQNPSIGIYNITFGGDGFYSVVSSFIIEVGNPYQLNVPEVHTMVTATYCFYLSVSLLLPCLLIMQTSTHINIYDLSHRIITRFTIYILCMQQRDLCR